MFRQLVNLLVVLMTVFFAAVASADTFKIRVLKDGAPVPGVSFVGNQGFNSNGTQITDVNGYLEFVASSKQLADGLYIVPFKNSGEALTFSPAVVDVSNILCRAGKCEDVIAKAGPRQQIFHVSTVTPNGRPVGGIPVAAMWSNADKVYVTDADGYAAIPVAARTTCSDTDSDTTNNFVYYMPTNPAGSTYTFADTRNFRQCVTRNAFATITVTGGTHPAVAVGSSVTYYVQFSTPDGQPIEGVVAYGPNLAGVAQSARTSNAYGLLRINTAEAGVDKNYQFTLFFSHPLYRIAQQAYKLSPNSCRNNECTLRGVRTSDSSSKSIVSVWQVMKDYSTDPLSGVRIQDADVTTFTDSRGYAYFSPKFDPNCTAPQIVSPTYDGCTFSSSSSFSLCAAAAVNSASMNANCSGQTPGEVEFEGRVFNKFGLPFANRAVLANGQFAAMTDSEGRYSFLADKGADLSVSVNSDGGILFDPVYFGFKNLGAAQSGIVFNQVLPVPEDDFIIGDGCEVSDRYVIRGTVTDYNGAPVAGVTIHNGEESNPVAVTDTMGGYSFAVDAMSDVFAHAELGAQNFAPAAYVLPRRICNATNLDFQFTQLESYQVSGRVTYGGSSPASGVTVGVVSEDNGKQNYYTTTTYDDGTYDLFVTEGSLARVKVVTDIVGATISPDYHEFYADNNVDDKDFVIALPATPTPSPTAPPVATPTPINTPAPQPTPSATPAPTITSAPITPAPNTPQPTATVIPTNPIVVPPTGAPTAIATPIPTITSAPTQTPTRTATPSPSATVAPIPSVSPTSTVVPPSPTVAPTSMPTSAPALEVVIEPDCEDKGKGELNWIAKNPNLTQVVLIYSVKNANPPVTAALVLPPGESKFSTPVSKSIPFEYVLEFVVSGRLPNTNPVAHHRQACKGNDKKDPTPTPSVTVTPIPSPSGSPTVAPSTTPMPTATALPMPTYQPTPEPTPTPMDLALSAGCTAYQGYLRWIITNYGGAGRVVLLRVLGQDSVLSAWAPSGESEVYTPVVNGSPNTMVAYTAEGAQFGVAAPNFNRCGSEATPTPSATATGAPTGIPTANPTATPPVFEPVPTASSTPVPFPTYEPPVNPSAAPTGMPTSNPTNVPTAFPTVVPTSAPTPMPTVTPINPENLITRSIACSATPKSVSVNVGNNNSYGVIIRYYVLESGVASGFWLQSMSTNSFDLPMANGETTTIAFSINDSSLPVFYLQIGNANCGGYEPTPTPTVAPTPTPEPDFVLSGSVLDQNGRRVAGRAAVRLGNLIAQDRLKIVVEDSSGDEVGRVSPFFSDGKLVWAMSVKAGIYNIKLIGARVLSKPTRFTNIVVSTKTSKKVAVPGSQPPGEDPVLKDGRTGFSYSVR